MCLSKYIIKLCKVELKGWLSNEECLLFTEDLIVHSTEAAAHPAPMLFAEDPSLVPSTEAAARQCPPLSL